MTQSAWQRRIERARLLIEQYRSAREILAFYIEVARFQERLGGHLSGVGANASPNGLQRELGGSELSVLLGDFESFLAVVEEHGPQPLAALSQELRGQGPESWAELLKAEWTSASPSDAAGFLATTFLQPYAELLRSQRIADFDPQRYALCPFCKRKPGFGVMRQMGDGGARSLICGFCSGEWDFRRLVCPGCGEEDDKKLAVFSAADFGHIRVECCESCRTYIKTVDLTKDGHAEPIVDELASVALDLWAQERGYAKLRKNLLGM